MFEPVATGALLRIVGTLLDSLELGFCAFDTAERTTIWNQTFLVFFPEHAGHVHAGEPYRENLRRFYAARLDADERQQIDRYIEEGIARHRSQTRPFSFHHRGRQLRVASLPIPGIGRIRIWQDLTAGRENAPDRPAQMLPIDLLEHLADGATILDQDNRIVAANDEFRRLYAIPPGRSVIGTTLESVVRAAWEAEPDCAPEREVAVMDNIRFAGAPFEIELPRGEWRRVIARRTAEGLGYFTHASITLLKRQQAELRAAEQRARRDEARYRLLAEHANDVIVAVDGGGVVRFLSPAAGRIFGWDVDAMVGTPFRDLIHADDRGVLSAGGGEGAFLRDVFTCRVLARDGTSVWMEASVGTAGGGGEEGAFAYVVSLRDVTERLVAERALRQAHDELSLAATTDALTGLANRRGFDAAFRVEVMRAAASGLPFALVLVDIDHFKSVNDRFGHPVGDECLRRVARVIANSARRRTDVAARYGGEEFAVLLPNIPAAAARKLGEAIRANVAGERWADVHPSLTGLTVSVGIACAGEPRATDMRGIFAVADEALYSAKRAGRDRTALLEVPPSQPGNAQPEGADAR